MRAHAVELRRALFASLGLGVACSAQAPVPSGDGEVVIPTPASAGSDDGRPLAPRPKPVASGYADGPLGWHRGGPETCDATISLESCKGNESSKRCSTDADCVEHPHGKCTSGVGQIGTYCGCSYSCATDGDCAGYADNRDTDSPPSHEVCICKPALGGQFASSICAPATCTADAECESGTCGVSTYHNGCYARPELACRTANDTCKTGADCGDSGGQCVLAGDRWSCKGRSCAIGRPLVVNGRSASSALSPRRDWLSRGGDAGEEGAPQDLEAAAFWAEVARLEHASVASFARFTLQLLALGAPPDLLRDTHAASLDEIEHARLAFGVARALGGDAHGPGPLTEALAPISGDVAEVVSALVHEGCVGETLGALEGAAQLDAAMGPAKVALARIAPDEARHAALAWRSLAWLLDAFGEEASGPARAAFREEMAGSVVVSPRGGAATNGVLDAAEIAALRSAALREVVGPTSAALLG